MIKLKLLDAETIRLSSIFNRMGLDGKETDFSIVRTNKSKNDYIGWVAYDFEPYSLDVLAIGEERIFKVSEENPMLGLRPAVRYSDIADLCENPILNKKGVLEIEYGEYPQTKVSDEEKIILNYMSLTDQLTETGKEYKIFARDVRFSIAEGPRLDESTEEFLVIKEVVDEDGNKYVKRREDWFRVEPIKWCVDLEQDFAISKNILTGGMPYGKYKIEYLSEEEKEFERTHPMKYPYSQQRTDRLRQINPSIIEGYLNVVLSNDILKSDEYIKSINSLPKQKLLKK